MKPSSVLVPVLLVIPSLVTLGGDFVIDPATVEREGPAYRYPRAGWIVLHVEGEPHERGFQHGRLLAPEIAGYIKCYATMQSPKAPAEGWSLTRVLVDSLFTRRFDPEILEELKGIADGAAAGGARFDGRPVDLTDIVAINVWPEVMTLDGALEATPTGLEGKRFPRPEAPRPPAPAPVLRCSAFAATGPATRDGRAIIGHITMFSLYACNFFNVWVDLEPARGHRVIYQTSPGGVQSGLDYYQNDAGLVLVETTISQTRFHGAGESLGSQSRRAMQYGKSIDEAVAIFRQGGNGLYTNEWLLADAKTEEIALFELGTAIDFLLRSSKGQWFGGTEGFYWGCNNTKDRSIRLETLASTADRPANVSFVPTERDRRWIQLYREHRGKIDADFARLAFTTAPLAYHSSCDAKFTTSEMALRLESWALFGPPRGKSWQPTLEERARYPDILPLVTNPWARLSPLEPPPASAEACATVAAVDLRPERERRTRNREDDGERDGDADDEDPGARPEPAWRGTILPASGGDEWLSASFAALEPIAGREREIFRRKGPDAAPSPAERDRFALARFALRSEYLAAVRRLGKEETLAAIRPDLADEGWHEIARGRGSLLLQDLRARLGIDVADRMLDEFGLEHAGRPASTGEFIAAASKAAGEDLAAAFRPWLESPGLPALSLGELELKDKRLEGHVDIEGSPQPSAIEITVEHDGGETTKSFPVRKGRCEYSFDLDRTPRRVIADKYGLAGRANGPVFGVRSFRRDLAGTLIVFGTVDEVDANREAAEILQKAIVEARTNFEVRIEADSALKDDDLRGRHLILIGRPATNALAARFEAAFPVRFGPRSFSVRGKTYAHMRTAVLVAGESPLDASRSVVCVAGMSPTATLLAAPEAARGRNAPVRILPAYGKRIDLVPAPTELERKLGGLAEPVR